MEESLKNIKEIKEGNRKIISNENWNGNTGRKKISKEDHVLESNNVGKKELGRSPYETEMKIQGANHHWIKQYIPINGKKYYYNSCLCGVNNIKDERYAKHYPEFHTTTTTTTKYVLEI